MRKTTTISIVLLLILASFGLTYIYVGAKKDQERLAHCLCKTHAKFILIIKRTPFIYGLYSNKKNIKITMFEKTYLYNVKGRNERDAEHLIIYNL